MIKFANFEFIFAIKDPELERRGQEHTLNTIQNRDFFTCTLGVVWGGQGRGAIHPNHSID